MATISFGPAGAYSAFHMGVAMYMKESIAIDWNQASVYSISGGVTGLLLLVCDSPEEIYIRAERACRIMGTLKNRLYPYVYMARTCRLALEEIFPIDAHLRLGDRAIFGLTHWPSFKRVSIRGPFATRESLIQACLASAYIPGYFLSLPPPLYRGFIDGGFTHSFCETPENSVVVNVGRLGVSDVWYDESKSFHLSLQSADEYMLIFWTGYNAAKSQHGIIVNKLRLNGFPNAA